MKKTAIDRTSTTYLEPMTMVINASRYGNPGGTIVCGLKSNTYPYLSRWIGPAQNSKRPLQSLLARQLRTTASSA